MKKYKKIYIEITNVCNLACSFCPKTMRKPEFMKIETFCNILDQIKPYTDYIFFHVKGEPLLHPDLEKFLDVSFDKGFKVNITSNGTLINRAKDKMLLKPALRQVNFSLHSFQRKDECDNELEYINNILLFTREAREKSEVIISLRLWNLEQDNAVNLETERNRDILRIIEKEFDLNYKIQEEVSPQRGMKIADKVYLNQDYEFTWPDLKEKEDNGVGFCYGLRDQVAILVDGTVVPCCLDGEGIINLGNIKTVNFSKIIESDRAKNIFNGFSRRAAVEELCRKCGYRKKFGTDRLN